MLCHPGEIRTEETIRQHLTWPGLKTDLLKCEKKCQEAKEEIRTHSPQISQIATLGTSMCRHDRPLQIQRKGKKTLHLQAITTKNPATGWFKIVQSETKTADVVANKVELTWLSRYPWPTKNTYNHGSEFIGSEFQDLIKQEYDIEARPSSK
jgi:hypothetical protein